MFGYPHLWKPPHDYVILIDLILHHWPMCGVRAKSLLPCNCSQMNGTRISPGNRETMVYLYVQLQMVADLYGGNGFYHPFLVILGMIYYCFNHIA